MARERRFIWTPCLESGRVARMGAGGSYSPAAGLSTTRSGGLEGERAAPVALRQAVLHAGAAGGQKAAQAASTGVELAMARKIGLEGGGDRRRLPHNLSGRW